MILIVLIFILLGGGLLAWIAGRWNPVLSRIIALLATMAMLVATIVLWLQNPAETSDGKWLVSYTQEWIPAFGIQFKLAADGLSLLMLVLTSVLGIMAVLASWKGITKRVGFFHFNLLVYSCGNYRCFCGARSFPVLLFLGTYADSHVFPH